MFILHALGYEMPPQFETLKEARAAMAENIREDQHFTCHKLSCIKHDKNHKELKIGGRQSITTFSEYWIEKI